MKPATREWVDKAEGDFATARRELAVEDEPNPDAVCFHAQQCAEKYLKAVLIEHGLGFPKTHDLAIILSLVEAIEPAWEGLREDLNALTDRAVEVRYPGNPSEPDDAREAFEIASKVRRLVRERLVPA